MCHTDYMIKELKSHISRLKTENESLKCEIELLKNSLLDIEIVRRDSLAMAALASSNDFYGCKETAERCYRQADAMLKARDA